jgi:signal transduction histidine kinase
LHGGRLEIDSVKGSGTSVGVILPPRPAGVADAGDHNAGYDTI